MVLQKLKKQKPSKKVVDKWKKQEPAATEVQIKHAAFGMRICNRFKDSKSEVNNHLCCFWQEKLKSGETQSGLLDAIRAAWYKYHVHKAVKGSQLQQKKRDRKKGIDTTTEQYLTNIEASRVKMAEAKLKTLTSDNRYFPSSWLTFVFLGPPAGPPPLRRISFCAGKYAEGSKGSTILNPSDALEQGGASSSRGSNTRASTPQENIRFIAAAAAGGRDARRRLVFVDSY